MKYCTVEIVNAEFEYSKPSDRPGALRFPGYRVTDKAGNAKWIPKDKFEKEYRPLDD